MGPSPTEFGAGTNLFVHYSINCNDFGVNWSPLQEVCIKQSIY